MKDDSSVVRGALIIVLAGAALGMTYNGMGLSSHPPRGIPWVASQAELPSLEDVAPADTLGAAIEPPAVSTPGTSAPSSGAPPAAGATGAPRGSKSPGSEPTTKSPASEPATPTTPPATGSSPMPEPRRTAPPPFVPEGDQPLQVQIETVARFYDARGALFLDARDPAEYEKGHIPGAIRLTNAEAQSEPERIKALPVRGRPIICYCEGGACEASLDLARFLIESGYRKVLVYMGGYPEWEAAMKPVEKGKGQ